MPARKGQNNGLTGYKKPRQSYVKDGIGYIELNKGYWTKVDEEDFERVRAITWHVIRKRRVLYVQGSLGKGRASRGERLHRFAPKASHSVGLARVCVKYGNL
jgi:hypothetical protein